jgi:hypothetical protein
MLLVILESIFETLFFYRTFSADLLGVFPEQMVLSVGSVEIAV